MTTDAKGRQRIPRMRAAGRDIYEDNVCGNHVALISRHGRSEEEAHEIAELFSDASVVYSETGLTPREMVDERNYMIGLLRDALDCMEGEWGDCGGGTPYHQENCTQCKIRSVLSPEKKEPKS